MQDGVSKRTARDAGHGVARLIREDELKETTAWNRAGYLLRTQAFAIASS
jgi:hypothetical protein